MTATYALEPLPPEEAARWDELIAPYETRQLFHRRAWLDYLAASRPLQVRLWAIRERGRTVGYFCGGIMRKGPFRILGSPLKGWGTNFMGPIAGPDLDQRAFLRAVDELAARERLAVVEMESPELRDGPMETHGYEPLHQQTYVVELSPGDPAKVWDRIDLKSRQKIRKAKRLGASVREATGAAFAAEFYDQFVEVLARKTLSPPYGPECPRALLEVLAPRGMVYALDVTDPDGRSIATGIFPHDDRTVYYWGGASRLAGWQFSPNDLLQWAAMETACLRGLQIYNMCGYGYFKSKFGGVLEHPKRWHKNYSAAARWARRGYELYFEQRIRLHGWWRRRALPQVAE
jgi:CelD/BcsL family acetyltransferase involved in cellulose biosynthesis